MFTETKFDQRLTPIRTIRVRHKNEKSGSAGLLLGVELFDFAGKSITKAGELANSKATSLFTDQYIDLVAGERIIG